MYKIWYENYFDNGFVWIAAPKPLLEKDVSFYYIGKEILIKEDIKFKIMGEEKKNYINYLKMKYYLKQQIL